MLPTIHDARRHESPIRLVEIHGFSVRLVEGMGVSGKWWELGIFWFLDGLAGKGGPTTPVSA